MRSLLATLLALFLAGAASAQSPAPDPLQDREADWPAWLAGGPAGDRDMPPPLGPFNYVREFDQIVAFLATWQVADPDSSDYGGMIEAESGYLGDVVQTDNTLEAIWSWSRYREFSGRATYDDNVAAAWIYSTNYPAWNEEGNAGDNYYRAHNCAWGLTAVLKYKDATGDASHDDYAATCAQYIVDHPLDIWSGTVWTQRLNFFVKGWCAGNLYLYGEAIGDPSIMAEAVAQGQDVLDWINVNPIVNVDLEYWAMSSGTAVWGVCNSVFRDDPAAGIAWCDLYAYDVPMWQDWYNVPGYDWDVSWDVAYANAKFAMSDVQGNPIQAFFGANTTNALLSYDTDDDGGIMAESLDPDSEDMTWVTNYLCKFGVDRLMYGPPQRDVGVLGFAEPNDNQDIMWVVGDTLRWKILASNFGVEDAAGVELHFNGGAVGVGDTLIDIDFARVDTILVSEYVLEYPGFYNMEAWTVWPGDEEGVNDDFQYSLYVNESTDVPDFAESGLRVLRNPFAGAAEFRLSLARDRELRLEIFDVSGRRVRGLDEGRLAAGEHTITWDGRDEGGRAMPAGVYLYRMETSRSVQSGRLVKLR